MIPRMYSLDVIRKINNRAARPHETETTRHSSFNETRLGIVLHSAKQRNTVFIKSGRAAKVFLQKIWSTNSADKRDQIIESYFA